LPGYSLQQRLLFHKAQVQKHYKRVKDLIDELIADQIDHHGPDAFIDLLARTGEVSKTIEALSLEVEALESFEAKAAMENVKLFWQRVENELAQVLGVLLLVFLKMSLSG